ARRLGVRTVLSDVVVDTCGDERGFAELVRHELRWLRTIRAVRPIGYMLSVITFSVPVAVFGSLLARGALPALALPFRDVLSLGLWVWGFATRRVHWREDRYSVSRDGSAHPVVRITQ